MGLGYKAILWNRQKKQYDWTIAILAVIYLLLFAFVTMVIHEKTTLETLIIRSTGSLAIVMLHIILAIGPLCRLNTNFLPLLYNRRHLGVSMFLIAAIHGIFSIIQFHTLGNVDPLTSLFTSNMDYNSFSNFPFQVLGFFALLIFFLLASTSHDFWLANLGPKLWKQLHMLVYVAFVLVFFHVLLGAVQDAESNYLRIAIYLGASILTILHLTAAWKERSKDQKIDGTEWIAVCNVEEIQEDRAKIFTLEKERVAIFKYDGKLSAVSNDCKHQGGPLGEGKIVDGCITCPWHGYQYHPQNGQSPPPFEEKIATYRLKLEGDKIYINPKAEQEGAEIEPIYCNHA